LPPPTVIWGIIGAIFGIEREELYDFARENNLVVGAELCDFKGLATEKATLMSYDTGSKAFVRTVEDFEFLIEPCFKIGVYAEKKLIEELRQRIETKSFEFDIYGGISDCFLKNIKNDDGAKFTKKTSVRGMVPVNLVNGFSQIAEGSRIVRVLYLNTLFYQGFNVEFRVKKPIKTVDGIAVWDVDDIKQFRKGTLE